MVPLWFIPPPWWLGVFIRVCGGSMVIASRGNLNSADSLGAQGYLGVPPQPPARTALIAARRCLARAPNSRCLLPKHRLQSVLALGVLYQSWGGDGFLFAIWR